MKNWKNIVFCVLLLSLHLSIRFFSESYLIFYVALFLVSLAILSGKKNSITINTGTILATIIFVSLVIRILLQGNQYGTFWIYVPVSCWLLFFIWIILFDQERKKIKIIAGIFIFTCIIELVLGFAQLFGILNSYNEHFSLTGSFDNPNAYSGYLSVVSPLILSLLLTCQRSRKVENLRYVLAGCLLLIVYMLLMSRSRGAWLACGVGCLYVLTLHYSLIEKFKKLLPTIARRVVAIVSVAVVLCAGGYALYQWKAESAFGRLLVWKITTPKSLSVLGNGIGSFEAEYGKWQSTYFASGRGSEAERYVADYVTCAYNDFLEIGVEQGIIVTLLFIALLYSAFRKKAGVKSALFVGAQASIVSIIALMFVTYPLKIAAIYIYLIFCLTVVFHEQKEKSLFRVKALWLKWSLPIVALLIAVAGSYNIYGYNLLNKGEIFVLRGQLNKGIEVFQKAEPILKNNAVSHFYYGSALFLKKEYDIAINELKLSCEKSSNPNGFVLLGNSYKEIGQTDKAKESYLTAINMIPSKLYPQYLMAKLLIENHEPEEAKIWANQILATKEKTPTTAAKEIKTEMEQLLNNNMSNLKNDLPMEK